MVSPDYRIPEPESAEATEGYAQWLRAKVARAIADTRPAIPHDQVAARIEAKIDAAKRATETRDRSIDL